MTLLRLTTFLLLALLLTPALCWGGLLEHVCTDCAAAEVCGHEDECAADPCPDDPVIASRTAMDSVTDTPALPIAILPRLGFTNDRLIEPRDWPPSAQKRLPLPESDLPLLI